MAFGVYLHIPYCLQRCTYCDFATYEKSKIMPSAQYVDLVLQEMDQKSDYFPKRPLDTLYFGGGTPSLLPPEEIVALIKGLEKQGFPLATDSEVTIEINPATISAEKLQVYLDHGINRFSVGAQTFDDRLLKMVHREHNARQTIETLELLSSRSLNFSFDILFALPTQSVEGLKQDLALSMDLGAKHVSPYCLTVPQGHPLSQRRPSDDEQIEMFDILRETLTARGFAAYEISNFALPSYESQHNLLYWQDDEYWGLGLSAHSYRKNPGWGSRFWNKSAIGEYRAQIEKDAHRRFSSPQNHLDDSQHEVLERHQSLTDFCHTALRTMQGLSLKKLGDKFTPDLALQIDWRLQKLAEKSWVIGDEGHWKLTPKGVILSNQVFAELTFLKDDLALPLH